MIREAEATLAPMPIYGQDRRQDPADSQALWDMTLAQRVEAMWAGQLTSSQLNEWTAKRPQEIPYLGGEFAWIVMRTEEWLDMSLEQKNNVIQLHAPRRIDRAAA